MQRAAVEALQAAGDKRPRPVPGLEQGARVAAADGDQLLHPQPEILSRLCGRSTPSYPLNTVRYNDRHGNWRGVPVAAWRGLLKRARSSDGLSDHALIECRLLYKRGD